MSKTLVVDAIGNHGLGDSGAGWYPLAKALAPKFKHVKWVLPTAPMQPVTMNHGYKMNSWFDVYDLRPDAERQDEKGLLQSVSTIHSIISSEVDAGIDPGRIVVGGFSQGSVISLLSAITCERKLAGVIALSGWLALSDKVKAMSVDHAKNYPVFWGHGTDDPVVIFDWGKRSVDKLRELGWRNIQFESYRGMPHAICQEEQEDMEKWLSKTLPEG